LLFDEKPPMPLSKASPSHIRAPCLALPNYARVIWHPAAAGGAGELEIWKDLAHVFQALPLPQAEAATDRIVRSIGRHTGWSA